MYEVVMLHLILCKQCQHRASKKAIIVKPQINLIDLQSHREGEFLMVY